MAFLAAGAKYAFWLPPKYVPFTPGYGQFGPLAGHMRWAHRTTRKMARRIFWKMAKHQAGLEKKQVLISRAVEIGTELFAMAAACSRAVAMAKEGGGKAYKIADLFCRRARRRIEGHFAGLASNDDPLHYKVAREVLDGDHTWLEYEMVDFGPYNLKQEEEQG
jgi:hypothetical protein